MKFSQHIKNQSGQVAIEYILISVVLIGIFLSARNILLSNNTLGSFVQKPWQLVAGMIETGVWDDPKIARSKHPGFVYRHNSFRGDPSGK